MMSEDHVFKFGTTAIVIEDHHLVPRGTMVKILSTSDDISHVEYMGNSSVKCLIPNEKLTPVYKNEMASLSARFDNADAKLNRIEDQLHNIDELLRKIDVSLCEG